MHVPLLATRWQALGAETKEEMVASLTIEEHQGPAYAKKPSGKTFREKHLVLPAAPRSSCCLHRPRLRWGHSRRDSDFVSGVESWVVYRKGYLDTFVPQKES